MSSLAVSASLPNQSPENPHYLRLMKISTPHIPHPSRQVLASYGQADPIPFFREANARMKRLDAAVSDGDNSLEGAFFALRTLSVYCTKQSPMMHKVWIAFPCMYACMSRTTLKTLIVVVFFPLARYL